MKKVFIPLLLLLGCSLVSIAQDSLTAARLNPIIGQAFVSNTCDTTGVVPGMSGPYVTWNFTGLTPISTDTALAVACSVTPNCSMFPGTTVAIKSLSGSTVNYAIATSTAYSQNGYYYSSSQYATFSDPMDQLHYPMHYLDSFVDAYAGIINYTGAIPITAHENGTVKVVYDAFGTLQLPDTTYNMAMRTHNYQVFVDSASVFGIDTVASFVLNSYSWYVSNYHSPVLSILISDQVGGGLHNKIVSYAKRYTGPLAITEIGKNAGEVTVYPNPSTGIVNVKIGGAIAGDASITLTDMMGREVAKIAAGSVLDNTSFNASGLAKGIYLVRVYNGAQTITRKLELQ